MTAEELSRQMASHPDIVIVDTRSSLEFRRGHVPGAVHLPFWAAAFLPLESASASTPVVVYCGHGPRAWMARVLLRWRGIRNVSLLDGHMAGWRRAGHLEQTGR
jgi:rhodanese-related sulfurtransferase